MWLSLTRVHGFHALTYHHNAIVLVNRGLLLPGIQVGNGRTVVLDDSPETTRMEVDITACDPNALLPQQDYLVQIVARDKHGRTQVRPCLARCRVHLRIDSVISAVRTPDQDTLRALPSGATCRCAHAHAAVSCHVIRVACMMSLRRQCLCACVSAMRRGASSAAWCRCSQPGVASDENPVSSCARQH